MAQLNFKNQIRFIKVMTCLFLLIVSIPTKAQLNWYYSVGNLTENPIDHTEINSPYLAFHQGEERKWIAYSPVSDDGRFYEVASSLSNAVAVGYVKGRFDFLDKRIITPQKRATGIAVSVNQQKKLQWTYIHENGLMSSQLLHVVKLADGRAVISGWEQRKGQEKEAILICIDKKGQIVWQHKIANASGSALVINQKNQLTWLVINQGSKGYTTDIYQANNLTGQLKKIIQQPGEILRNDLHKKVPIAMVATLDGSFIVTRSLSGNPGKLSIIKYSKDGKILWRKELDCLSNEEAPMTLKDVTIRKSGNIQLAANLKGSMQLNGNQALNVSGTQNLLLITLDGVGNYLGYEQYGEEYANTNGFYSNGDQTGILGGQQGHLKIQNKLLSYQQDLTSNQAFQVFIAEFPWVAEELSTFLTDTAQFNAIKKLNIFPNPVTDGKVTIINEQVGTDQPYQIYLYGTDGRLAKAIGKQATGTISKDEIDVTDLAIGIYHVFYTQNNQLQRVGRFIISQ